MCCVGPGCTVVAVRIADRQQSAKWMVWPAQRHGMAAAIGVEVKLECHRDHLEGWGSGDQLLNGLLVYLEVLDGSIGWVGIVCMEGPGNV